MVGICSRCLCLNERMKQNHPITDRAGGALCNVLEPHSTCPAPWSLAGVLTVLGSEDPMTSSVGMACQWGLQLEPPLWALI